MKAGRLCRLIENDHLSMIHLAHGLEFAHQRIVDRQVLERFQLMRKFEKVVTLNPVELQRKFQLKSNKELQQMLYELESGEPT